MRQLGHYETIEKMPRIETDCVVFVCGVSCENLGLILRSADVFGVKAIYYYNAGDKIDQSRLCKLSRGSSVPVNYTDNVGALSVLKAEGYMVAALEITDSSVQISRLEFEKKTCLVIGNEQSGIPEEILAVSDYSCHIDMIGGRISSLNVAIAASIALHTIIQPYIELVG